MSDELADYIAITRLKYAWAKHYDGGDLERLIEVFAPDAVMDQGPYGIWEHHEGIRRGYEQRMALRTTPKARMHTLANPFIEIDGDAATGTWCLIDYAFDPAGGPPRGLLATYEDEYRRQPDGRWLISRSKIDILWSELGE